MVLPKSIGNYSFQCTSLSAIMFPNNVTTNGQYAFAVVPGLGNKLTIGSYAFQGATSLLTIPNSVFTIGSYSFDPNIGNKDAFNGWEAFITPACQQ